MAKGLSAGYISGNRVRKLLSHSVLCVLSLCEILHTESVPLSADCLYGATGVPLIESQGTSLQHVLCLVDVLFVILP